MSVVHPIQSRHLEPRSRLTRPETIRALFAGDVHDSDMGLSVRIGSEFRIQTRMPDMLQR